MENYQLSAGVMEEEPKKPKKLRYLVVIMKKGGDMAVQGHPSFLNDKCQHIGQYFTGKEEMPPFGKVVQLPHLFKTKKEANQTIKQAKKHDKAFGEKHSYEIVPIDIGECEN